MTVTYRNPWHHPTHGYDPAVYVTEAKAVPLGEFLMYQRIPGKPGRCCWDVVKDGVCIAQRAGRPDESQLAEFRAKVPELIARANALHPHPLA